MDFTWTQHISRSIISYSTSTDLNLLVLKHWYMLCVVETTVKCDSAQQCAQTWHSSRRVTLVHDRWFYTASPNASCWCNGFNRMLRVFIHPDGDWVCNRKCLAHIHTPKYFWERFKTDTNSDWNGNKDLIRASVHNRNSESAPSPMTALMPLKFWLFVILQMLFF